MKFFINLIAAVRSFIRRKRIKQDIKNLGGRVTGYVKLTVGENATFTFGKALYLNGGGITAAKRMQIIVTGGANYVLAITLEYPPLPYSVRMRL